MDKPITVTDSAARTELKGCGSVEQDLVDARQQLETIFDTMQAGIILVNPQGIITFANQRMADMFGWPLEDLVGSGYSGHVHPDQRNAGDERMRSLIAGKIDHVHHERHYVRRDGSDFWGHLSGRRQEDGQGNLVSLVGVIADISEIKNAQQAIQESEERYRTIVENMQDVYYRADTEGKLVMVSPSGAEMLGYDSVEQILGCSIRDIFYYDPEERDAFLHNLRLKGKISGYELTLKSRGGSPVPVSVSSHLLFAADGSFMGVEGVCHDISQFRQAMDNLKASEDKFARAFNSAPVLMSISSIEDGRYLEVNDRFCEISGFSRQELLGRTSIELGWFSSAERERVIALFKLEGRIHDMEIPLTAKDGRTVYCLYSAEQITLEGESRLLSIATDITERKRVESALQESELKFRTLFATLQDAIYLTRADDGQIVECSDKMSGYARDELIGRSTMELNLWADMNQRQQVVDLVRADGFVNDFEATFRRKDGTVFSGSISTNVLTLHNGTFLLSVIRDMTERKRAEESLQESRELFMLFMKYTPVYTFIKQIEGGQSRVIQVSDNFVDMVGKPAEELRGRTMYELFPAEFARKITDDDVAVVNGRKVIQLDEDLNGRNYTTIKFPIYREGRDSLIAGFTIDVTERKRNEEERRHMEQQLVYAQKLESLGVLAGGIAHDFNNILMTIVGNADLALMRLSKESPVVDNLHCIEQAAARAADLARQMLAYSGKGKFVVESIDLNRLLEEMLHMLEVSISKKAVLRLNLTKPLPLVEADATQMRQIIMNLVINASEAIGDKSGVIAINTGCMDCDRNYLKDVWLDENLSGGLYVYLEIVDSGCGMSRETLDRIFDPFYTTKFTGRGLGMAAVLGIVRGHRGAIKVSSEPEAGTTFKVLFPASGKPAELFDEVPHHEDRKRAGTVLLVDDEETVRGIGSEMLKELGFTVITADDGRKAIDVFQQNLDVCFVLLDLTMPHMDGEQCFRELRRIKPDVRVIMSSGYNEQEVTQKFAGKGLNGFIQKPYRLSMLQEAIRRIQDE
ncbi:MAG: PAS domain S-box protein [Pelobacteraceae bacterium]